MMDPISWSVLVCGAPLFGGSTMAAHVSSYGTLSRENHLHMQILGGATELGIGI